MRVKKERTGDGGTSTIRKQKYETAESVLQFLLSVNEEGITDPEQIAELCKEAIGRTGVTEEMRMYLIGKMYGMRKLELKRMKRKFHAPNDKYPCPRGGGGRREIADYVAQEIGIGPTTVKRYGLYAKGIEAIWSVEPDVAEAILATKKIVSLKAVADIGKAEPEVRKSMIDVTILRKSVLTETEVRRPAKRSKDMNMIAECVSSLFGTAENTYTVASLVRDIRMNSEPFINMLSQLVEQHKDLCARHKNEVMKALIESVIYKIEEIEEEIKHYE